ncbi:hypothetical protein [Lentzea guizhouensis]|uniref:hypothetical protein n=1 Tax=Lentzea guizhouensis TaxID=1586287 RepID=UPI0012B6AAD2|nr:hypothetical protein [Lentzea guizhouensis]
MKSPEVENISRYLSALIITVVSLVFGGIVRDDETNVGTPVLVNQVGSVATFRLTQRDKPWVTLLDRLLRTRGDRDDARLDRVVALGSALGGRGLGRLTF